MAPPSGVATATPPALAAVALRYLPTTVVVKAAVTSQVEATALAAAISLAVVAKVIRIKRN